MATKDPRDTTIPLISGPANNNRSCGILDFRGKLFLLFHLPSRDFEEGAIMVPVAWFKWLLEQIWLSMKTPPKPEDKLKILNSF